MNRRELLQHVATLMGGAISAPALLGVLSGCSAKQTPAWKPQFLSEEQVGLVSELAELIIPHTETPGAKEVGVPAFIDVMLKDVYAKEDQDRFLEGLKAFEARAEREHGARFIELDPKARLALVTDVHDRAVAHERALDVRPSELKRPFILMMKELTMLGFFTSEVGARQVLQYAAVPGGYQACLPIEKAGNGRTWAQEGSLPF